MGRMVRKQIYIEPEQEQLLKRQAKEQGVAASDLIRRSIDQITRVPTALSLDRGAWQDELAFIHKRARSKALSRRRRWTREELYEDRLKRFSR